MKSVSCFLVLFSLRRSCEVRKKNNSRVVSSVIFRVRRLCHVCVLVFVSSCHSFSSCLIHLLVSLVSLSRLVIRVVFFRLFVSFAFVVALVILLLLCFHSCFFSSCFLISFFVSCPFVS